jgi:outer membrane biosynthesis protein TonB
MFQTEQMGLTGRKRTFCAELQGAMEPRNCTAVLLGVGLSIFAPGLLTAGPAGAAEARPAAEEAPAVPTTTIEVPASAPDAAPADPEVAVVGAKRKPRGPVSSPPPPVDTSPPPPPPVAPPPPPEPEPAPPAPPPAPPVSAPEVVSAPAPPAPPPPARAPYGEPRVDTATRLPTTGNGLGSRFAAWAGACLGLGGLCIAGGARRRERRSP